MKEIKQELEKCNEILHDVLKELRRYKRGFYDWYSFKKNLLRGMKRQFIDPKIFEIISFSEERYNFLANKTQTVESYIAYIENTLNSLTDDIDIVEVESLRNVMDFMLISIGYSEILLGPKDDEE